MGLLENMSTGIYSKQMLLPDNLDQHPLSALAIEFPVKDLFPRTEVRLAVGHSNDDLASHIFHLMRASALSSQPLCL